MTQDFGGRKVDGALMIVRHAESMSNAPPWSCIPLADRLYLVWLEAGMRRFPPWMLGTLYEVIATLGAIKHESPVTSTSRV
jgi:hypothetical protein